MRFASPGLVAVAALLPATAPAQDRSGPARLAVPLGLDLYRRVPDKNPLSAAKIALGRRLFFDSVLAQDRKVACASCHQPERAFTDGRAVSVGVSGRVGTRHVPTLVNRTYGESFFWDGRITNLEEQVVQPIQHPKELSMTLEAVVGRLKGDADYPGLFRLAFGRPVNAEDLARALASYVRTILSGDAPIDRYMAGDSTALAAKARQGLQLFRGRANCTSCHLGPSFSDERFHNTGVAFRDGELADLGRFVVTGDDDDRGAFKTLTLREVARTAPYMHDGSIATLEDVVEFYNRGGNDNPYLDPDIRPLNLTEEEKAALVAFLRSLSGTVQEGLKEY